MLANFTLMEILLTGVLFAWAGFVRSGLGFGGAALGLPLMLFIDDRPIFWLPMIGLHLLFFSGLTLRTRLNNVDWTYLKYTSYCIIPAALVGVFGLLSLPNTLLVVFIYSVTLLYGCMWLINVKFHSNNKWLDRLFLVLGGYVAGISLSGAPIMVAVFMRNVVREQLRNTLFVMWFILVSMKMSAFAILGVELNLLSALALIPAAAIGHIIGLKTHDLILKNDRLFKQSIGSVLIIISLLGLWHIW